MVRGNHQRITFCSEDHARKQCTYKQHYAGKLWKRTMTPRALFEGAKSWLYFCRGLRHKVNAFLDQAFTVDLTTETSALNAPET